MVYRLVAPMVEAGIWDMGDGQDIDTASAMLTEEAVGAAIGVCWRHSTEELEAQRSHYSRDAEGLLDYGAAVLEELYEEGYSQDDLTPIISTLGTKLISSTLPSPQEVGDRVGFTAPGAALAT